MRGSKVPPSGLPTAASSVALIVLVLALVVDVALQTAEIVLYGIGGLDGAGNFLGSWDLAKAILTTAALLISAKRLRSAPFAAFGIVYFVVASEDQLALHHVVSRRAASLIRTAVSNVGWTFAHAQAVGQLLVLTLFAAAGLALIWVWKRPAAKAERRARLVLTGLLVTLYVFAGGVDFLGSILPGRLCPAVEESGERLAMTLSLAYVAGLVSIRRAR